MNTDKLREWESQVKSIGQYLGCNEQELWSEMKLLLEEQEAGHKMKLENIAKELETIDFKEKHICRFNDGEQNCECYLQGLQDALSIIRSHIK